MTRSPFVVDSSQARTAVRLACVLMVASLAGCSTVEGWFSSDKVDYKNGSRQTGGLEVPPDLTQLARDGRAQIEGGTVSAAALQQQEQAKNAGNPSQRSNRVATANGSRPVALNSVGETRIERSGSDRWVHTSLTPEEVWPQLAAFWKDKGFELVQNQADIGMMQTNWVENRSKVPQDFLRRTLGKFADALYSSGEKDMYRSRVERDDKGGTDVFISHFGSSEVYTDQAKDQLAWQARPTDPLLEAEMLSRLMLKLGGKAEDTSMAAVASADGASAPIVVPNSTLPDAKKARPLSEVPTSLQFNDNFDRAWRRVGLSLDRHGFTIEDRDRTMGMFFLRYADPSQAGKEEPNFFQRLFSSSKPAEQMRYRVLVKTEGTVTTVMVLDGKGQQQTNDIAKGILNLLMDDLR